MMANQESFITSEEKIIFMLSYLKGGLTSQWAANEYEEILEDRYVTTCSGNSTQGCRTPSVTQTRSAMLNTKFPQPIKGSTKLPRSSSKNVNSTDKLLGT